MDLSVPLFQNTNYEVVDTEDVPTSVLVLHSSNDFTEDNKQSWYELLKDNPFAEHQATQSGDDDQMTSERFAKRVVSLGSNSHMHFYNATPPFVVPCNESDSSRNRQTSEQWSRRQKTSEKLQTSSGNHSPLSLMTH